MEIGLVLRQLEDALHGGRPFVAGLGLDGANPFDPVGDTLKPPPGTAVTVATSGSTGAGRGPRWVALSADALRASAAASTERLGGTGQWLLALPPDHIAGINVLVRGLLAGGIRTMPSGHFSPQEFSLAATKMGPGQRYVSLVPTQLGRLLQAGQPAVDALSGFTAVLIGGAKLDPKLRATATQAGINLVETYGMAETCGGCVYDGLPLGGVTVEIGPSGVIRLAGPVLALGYLGSAGPSPSDGPDPAGLDQSGAAQTDAGQPAAPHSGQFVETAGKRWFVSSDLGRRTASGKLEVLGRSDNAITTGGLTVLPEAVEQALRELPEISDALVTGLPDDAWGEAVSALVIAQDGAEVSLETVRHHIKDRLGPTAAPRQIALVLALPLLAPGKPDRAGAKSLAAQLAADGHMLALR
ncbi:MAG: AMP-binding protein [Bifidobacteriaceae bacterium]|jgi:O-succinylbenzoic acid--CoA ligase|nr:AMP-binding protein [Bifidobacteriaceae bacterium]